MNLIEESFQNEEEKKAKKTGKIILIIIAILVMLMIVIFSLMIILKEPELVVTVDGKTNAAVGSLLKFESDGTIYVPVKKIADQIGYQGFNGEYSNKSEEYNKCYVACEDEIANLQLNSNKVYKLNLNNTEENYDYYYMKKPVKSYQGELYISSDAMQTVFNTSFEYDVAKNKVTIYTMPYLVSAYTTKALDYGYSKVDDTFINYESVLNNLVVVKKSENKDTTGVIDITTGEAVVEPKYSKIEYLPSIGDFIVQSDNKYGVVSSKKETKIKVAYDEIKLIDKDAGVYLAKKDQKYGILDLKGNVKVNIEYDKVGVEANKFKDNNIKNNYLLVENLIPVKRNDLWGMYDKNGNLVVDFEYDSFGYIATNNKNAKNLLVIPDYDVIVACKDKKYALINSSGKPLFKPVVDDIYLAFENGETKYYMEFSDSKIDAETWLNNNGVKKSSDAATTTTNKNTTTNSSANTNTNSTTNSNQENVTTN